MIFVQSVLLSLGFEVLLLPLRLVQKLTRAQLASLPPPEVDLQWEILLTSRPQDFIDSVHRYGSTLQMLVHDTAAATRRALFQLRESSLLSPSNSDVVSSQSGMAMANIPNIKTVCCSLRRCLYILHHAR